MNRKQLELMCKKLDVKNLRAELDERKLRQWCIEWAAKTAGNAGNLVDVEAERIRKWVTRTK